MPRHSPNPWLPPRAGDRHPPREASGDPVLGFSGLPDAPRKNHAAAGNDATMYHARFLVGLVTSCGLASAFPCRNQASASAAKQSSPASSPAQSVG
ncbi:MAG: hypothetical protein ORN98_08485 [Alphaproteobacteria bacterium]|nr:hypothetical protein [Alphaproteobacteria bacterium]